MFMQIYENEILALTFQGTIKMPQYKTFSVLKQNS